MRSEIFIAEGKTLLDNTCKHGSFDSRCASFYLLFPQDQSLPFILIWSGPESTDTGTCVILLLVLWAVNKETSELSQVNIILSNAPTPWLSILLQLRCLLRWKQQAGGEELRWCGFKSHQYCSTFNSQSINNHPCDVAGASHPFQAVIVQY